MRPLVHRFYLLTVIATGTLVVGSSLLHLASFPPGGLWLVLTCLTVLGSYFPARLPAVPVKLSTSESFILAGTLLYGPPAGAATAFIEALTLASASEAARSTLTRFLFNAVVPATAIWTSGSVFYWFLGSPSGTLGKGDFVRLLPAVLGLAFLFLGTNSLLIAAATAGKTTGHSWMGDWWRNLRALRVNYLLGALIATFTATHINDVDLTVVVFVAAVLVVSYATLRASLGRLEDATRHVEQIAALYLSTIEALAMAVDAKDQITHGHIRRVQVFATELAKKLGVQDPSQLRAIETAALLHDMGKLAIPEFILNKPGKLSVVEFEKMKRHAEIGADLLSSISFPYPVVPIVRHHHENWDGTGYPSKLSSHDIPLGARILSVVDCFDALTSDRPYRPRMSNEDSFQILRDRSGSMYDPLVVDTFIQVFQEIAPAAIRAGLQAKSLVPTISDDKWQALNEIRGNAAQATILGELEQAVTEANSAREAFETAARYLTLLTPARVVAMFAVGADHDLACVAHEGEGAGVLNGLRIPNGERTTGWAVAHEAVMANSPAALDLEERAEQFTPALRSALVSPMKREGRSVGALCVYAVQVSPFDDDHRYVAERIADILASHVDPAEMSRHAVKHESPRHRMKP